MGISSIMIIQGMLLSAMVAIVPTLLTSLEERTPENTLSTLHTNNTPAILPRQKWYFLSQQYQKSKVVTQAAVTLLKMKRKPIIPTLPIFYALTPKHLNVLFSLSSLASIYSPFIMQQLKKRRRLEKAQNITTPCIASSFYQPQQQSVALIKRVVDNTPKECERYPTMLQQENTKTIASQACLGVIVHSSTSWERADCSIAIKGPVYPPKTEMAPIVPKIIIGIVMSV